MTRYELLDILNSKARIDQRSFHIASERSLRVEFMRFRLGNDLRTGQV
jgi:hypothetical protein